MTQHFNSSSLRLLNVFSDTAEREVMEEVKEICRCVLFLFWVPWVFLPAHQLSPVRVSRRRSSLPCTGFSRGFSCCRAPTLGARTSLVVARGAESLHGMWNLPGPGIKPMPLALGGRFLSTEPPGKSWPGTFLLDGSYTDTSALPLLGPDRCLRINVPRALFQVLSRCSITGILLCQ